MAESTLIGPKAETQPTSDFARELAQRVDYATLPPGVTMKSEEIDFKHNIFVVSVLTMIITSLAIFYVPLFSGLMAGAFGGYHAGKMKRALAAAAVTSIAVPVALAVAYFFAEQSFLRLFSGLGFWGWAALHVIGTFLGAISGAASRPLFTERDGLMEPAVPSGFIAPPVRGPDVVRTEVVRRDDWTVARNASEEREVPPSGPAREE